MARVKLSDELKKAISQLSHKEKDKLLHRLIAKDDLLVEQLEFRLLEMKETTEERRSDKLLEIQENIESFKNYYRLSPGNLTSTLRYSSGYINRHVRVTKDKYGEIELNLVMLNDALEKYGDAFIKYSPGRTYKLYDYIVKRTLKLLKLLQKIHEDYQMDFVEAFSTLGDHIASIHELRKVATQLGLNLNWLIDGAFPAEDEL